MVKNITRPLQPIPEDREITPSNIDIITVGNEQGRFLTINENGEKNIGEAFKTTVPNTGEVPIYAIFEHGSPGGERIPSGEFGWEETLKIVGHNEHRWIYFHRNGLARMTRTRTKRISAQFFGGTVTEEDTALRLSAPYLLLRNIWEEGSITGSKLYGLVVADGRSRVLGYLAPPNVNEPCVVSRHQQFYYGGIEFDTQGILRLIPQDECYDKVITALNSNESRVFVVPVNGQMFVSQYLLYWAPDPHNKIILVGSLGFVILPIHASFRVRWRRFVTVSYQLKPLEFQTELDNSHRFFVVKNGCLTPNLSNDVHFSVELFTRDTGVHFDPNRLQSVINHTGYGGFLQRDLTLFYENSLKEARTAIIYYGNGTGEAYWAPRKKVINRIDNDGTLWVQCIPNNRNDHNSMLLGAILIIKKGDIHMLMRDAHIMVDTSISRGMHLLSYHGKLFAFHLLATNSSFKDVFSTYSHLIGAVSRVISSHVDPEFPAIGLEFDATSDENVYIKRYVGFTPQQGYQLMPQTNVGNFFALICGKNGYVAVGDDYDSRPLSIRKKFNQRAYLVTENAFVVCRGADLKIAGPYGFDREGYLITPQRAVSIACEGNHSLLVEKYLYKERQSAAIRQFHLRYLTGSSEAILLDPFVLLFDLGLQTVHN